MRFRRYLEIAGFKIARMLGVCVWVVVLLLSTAVAQPTPKRVLVLYWDNKDVSWNTGFDRVFQADLQSAGDENIEYYPEYLESTRFPEENMSTSLHDYLRQKYSDRRIDVIVANSDAALNFLLKYRDDLFTYTPIVFIATQNSVTENLIGKDGFTGIFILNKFRQNLDLALRLHPDTKQVFVVSGTVERDKRLEMRAREDLRSFESKVQINYLTDFSLNDLIATTSNLPKQSLILFAWQRIPDERGRILDSPDVVAAIARSASVPIYGMTVGQVGTGINGGLVDTPESCASRAAEMVQRIANGARADDILPENNPTTPIFDSRQLQRWKIAEELLPANSIIRFRNPSFWQQYKLQVIGVLSLCLIETLLIFALLAQRSRRGRAEERLRLSEERFSKAFRSSPDPLAIVRRSDGIFLDVNDSWEELLGYSRDEAIGRTTLDLGLYLNNDDRDRFFAIVESEGFVHDFETDIRSKTGEFRRAHISAELIVIDSDSCLIIIIRDITERKRAEDALRKSEEALRQSHDRIKDLAGRLIIAQEEERRYIARELHDDLNQAVAALSIGLSKLETQLPQSSGAARDQLLRLKIRTLQISEGIRSLSHELHSSILEHLGLSEALKLQCSEFEKDQGIKVSFDLSGNNKLLDSDTALCLYRVVQESLRNVVKHSKSTRAELKLIIKEGSVEMRIVDHGIGFDVEKRHAKGIGLISMEERVRLLGGNLEVKSQSGEGTELTVLVPLKSKRAAVSGPM